MSKYLNMIESRGLAADIREAREALDKLEAAIARDEHPTRLGDFVRAVERPLDFARSFCFSAQRREAARAEFKRTREWTS